MNLLITTACNLQCPYCFAGPLRKQIGTTEMPWSEISRVLSSLDPEVDAIRLMGGEPTLHSAYPEVLQSLKNRGFQVVVFSNGTQPVLGQTVPNLPDKVLLNLNHREFYSAGQIMTIRENMAVLGDRIQLGYTITRPDFDLDWHRQLILAAGLQPNIRLGLAQPVIGGDNLILPDADLPAAHAAVVRWAGRLAEEGIHLSLDCGFMRCRFSESELEALIRAGTALRFECSPTVDVGPGLRVWRCYAFSHQGAAAFTNLADQGDLRAYFAQQGPPLSQTCAHCQHHLSGWCGGGCRARVQMRSDAA